MHNTTSPRPVTDESIEEEIQRKGLTAVRVTPADLEASIAGEYTFTAFDAVGEDAPRMDELKLLTICVLVLKNGFTLVGKSACASPENFDAAIGARIAREDAKQQLWPLLGFMVKDGLHRAEQAFTEG